MSFKKIIINSLFVLFSQSALASLIGIDTVDGVNSLYTTDWGHPYNTGSGNEFNAIGRGLPARAFEVSSSPFGFLSGTNLHLTATGCTVDAGVSCTGPGNDRGLFRGINVYALIGVWSTSATSITPVDMLSVNPAFYIGSLLDFVVPTFNSPLYLFMATNDGIFRDNSGHYTVRIEKVPTPAVLWLMLAGIFFIKRKNSA